jgi:hypothetical protein
MATTIVTKYGGDAPAASDIVRGELAVDTENGRLYTENAAGAVVEIGLNPEGNVDVTGSVTTTGNVGIGTSSPTAITNYTTVAVNGTTGGLIDFENGEVLNSRLVGEAGGLVVSGEGSRYVKFHTNNAERMRITSAGNVEIKSGGELVTYRADNTRTGKVYTDNNAMTLIASNDPIKYWANATSYHAFGFGTDTSTNEKVRITSAGNVGIGTSAPTKSLAVHASSGNTYVDISRATQSQGQVALQLVGGTGGQSWIMYQPASSNDLRFFTNSSDRVVFDASGNLLVGKTAVDVATQGIVLRGGTGESYFSRTNDNPVYINRNTSDGGLISFRKDGTTVGSIGTVSGLLGIGSGDAILAFDGTANAMYPMSSQTGGASNGVLDFGSSLRRFKDLYLSESVKLSANDVGGAGSNSIDFAHTGHTSGPSAQIHVDYTSDFRANLLFKINKAQSNSAPTEVARFTNGGNLLVGGTSQINSTNTSIYGSSSTNCLGIKNANNNNYLITALNSSNTEVFRVSGTGDVTNTNNSYGGISDARLKSNIIDAPSQLDDIMSVQVRSYTLNSTGEKHLGVVAQELEASGMSGLVSEDKEGMKSVKYSVLYMKAIKAIQEQQATIEALTARIAALES